MFTESCKTDVGSLDSLPDRLVGLDSPPEAGIGTLDSVLEDSRMDEILHAAVSIVICSIHVSLSPSKVSEGFLTTQSMNVVEL